MRQNGTMRAETAMIVHSVTAVENNFAKHQRLVIQNLGVRGLLNNKRCNGSGFSVLLSIDKVFTMNFFLKKKGIKALR